MSRTTSSQATARIKVEELLRELRRNTGASSTVLYLRDSVQPHYIRMVAQDGVLIPELMYGPVLPLTAAARVMLDTSSGRDEEWFIGPAIGKLNAVQSSGILAKPSTESDQKKKLVGSYVHRENVKSSLLIRYYDPNTPSELLAVLWVNFDASDGKRISTRINRSIQRTKREVGKCLRKLTAEESTDVSRRLSRFRSIHKAAKRFPKYQDCREEQNHRAGDLLGDYLETFLRTTLSALGVYDRGFGTVYLLDSDNVLRMAAQEGKLKSEHWSSFSVDHVEGLVSWSAIQKSPVLVDDPADRFEGFYVDINTKEPISISSELIVPLIIDGEVIGIVNLESEDKLFQKTDAFDLSSAARYVALCIQVLRQTESTYEHRAIAMLELASDAADETKCSTVRKQLERHAQSWMKADCCNIWEIDEDGAFVGSGKSTPRKDDGYSAWIRECKQAIWLQWPNVEDHDSISYKFWNSDTSDWESMTQVMPQRHPDGMNGDAVKNQLGVPVVLRDKCIAVVWFKFAKPELMPIPTKRSMGLARYLAAEIALILAMQDRHAIFGNQQGELAKLAATHEELFPSETMSFCGVDGFVVCKPLGAIGGDFYRYIDVPGRAKCIVVGDGEGHGLPGACHMFPLLTAAIACSEGKKYIGPRSLLCDMDQLVEQQDRRGTATCFNIDRSREVAGSKVKEEMPILSVASAGHEGFIVANKGGMHVLFDESGSLPFGVGETTFYGNHIDEKVFELEVGDVIVVFSDGVTDAGVKGPMGAFGLKGVTPIVTKMINHTPMEIALEIENRLLAHAEGYLADDYTIMVLKIGDLPS